METRTFLIISLLTLSGFYGCTAATVREHSVDTHGVESHCKSSEWSNPTQRPYNIGGIWYYPIPSSRGFVEQGIASWYGSDFHGKKTSNGEIYDMHAMTAAHKTLPLGTHVKVTRKDTGSSIIVRVNDRGPFVAGRVIDLSFSAAKGLDMVGPGTAPVVVEAIQIVEEHAVNEESRWEPEALPDFQHGRFTIQIGAYKTPYNAVKQKARLISSYEDIRVEKIRYRDEELFRVQVGQYGDLIEAHILCAQLQEKGFPDAQVVSLDNGGQEKEDK